MPLAHYRKKRDFIKTPEPSGKTPSARNLVFVVQLHDASHLHYDFRLKIGNVLKSWAIPKGPSMNPLEKRLAVETEDHPLAYANFEGIIPEDQYGGGIVLIWDHGTFKNITKKGAKRVALKTAYEQGHLVFELFGEKLKGQFVLQKFKTQGKSNWILLKIQDEYANKSNIIKQKPTSVVSGYKLSDFRKNKG